jgi:hypothetical protein
MGQGRAGRHGSAADGAAFMTSWQTKLCWSAVVVLYAAWAVRKSYDLVRPLIPVAVALTVVIAVSWFLVRRRRW